MGKDNSSRNLAGLGLTLLLAGLTTIQAEGGNVSGWLVLGYVLVVLAVAAFLGALLVERRKEPRPNLIVHGPERHYSVLGPGQEDAGRVFAAVKVPFANTKDPVTGRGVTVTGFHAEFRVLDTGGGHTSWLRARWDETKQQPERGAYASLTSPEVTTITLDPNGLKHYMETVIQVQAADGPPLLEPWTQAGRFGVAFQSPVIVEVRWEGNELPPGQGRMEVTGSDPPQLDPKGLWLQ